MPERTAIEVELGDVFYLTCTLCNPPKPKFFVVVQADPLRMVLINSQVNPFVRNKPRTLALHLLLHADCHEFLDHDSYHACDQLSHEYDRQRLLDLLGNDPSIRKGRIDDTVRPGIAAAFSNNHLVPKKYLRDIAPLWAEWRNTL